MAGQAGPRPTALVYTLEQAINLDFSLDHLELVRLIVMTEWYFLNCM